MANACLYIVNERTGQHVMIAKSMEPEWNLGNVAILQAFLADSFISDKLVIGSDDDEEFMNKYDFSHANNYNQKGGWKYEAI